MAKPYHATVDFKNKKLNFNQNYDERHEKFCQLVAGGMRPTEAFETVGFTASNPNVLRSSASRLSRRYKMRIAEIMGVNMLPEAMRVGETAQQAATILQAFQNDLPKLREKLWAIIDNENEPASARVMAIKECLNRALGLPIQFTETNVNVKYQISDREMTEDEWDAKYCRPLTLDHTEH